MKWFCSIWGLFSYLPVSLTNINNVNVCIWNCKSAKWVRRDYTKICLTLPWWPRLCPIQSHRRSSEFLETGANTYWHMLYETATPCKSLQAVTVVLDNPIPAMKKLCGPPAMDCGCVMADGWMSSMTGEMINNSLEQLTATANAPLDLRTITCSAVVRKGCCLKSVPDCHLTLLGISYCETWAKEYWHNWKWHE